MTNKNERRLCVITKDHAHWLGNAPALAGGWVDAGRGPLAVQVPLPGEGFAGETDDVLAYLTENEAGDGLVRWVRPSVAKELADDLRRQCQLDHLGPDTDEGEAARGTLALLALMGEGSRSR